MKSEVTRGSEVVKTILEVAKLGTPAQKQRLLSVAAHVLRRLENLHIEAESVHQEGVLLRLQGDLCGSQRRIQEFFDHSSASPELRSHSVFGLLYLSQAVNYAYTFESGRAHEEVQKWQPSGCTKRDMDVVWNLVYLAGREFRGQGRFEDARDCFHRCLATDELVCSALHRFNPHLLPPQHSTIASGFQGSALGFLSPRPVDWSLIVGARRWPDYITD